MQQPQYTKNNHSPLNYMLAVDHSPSSLYAFEEVHKMINPDRDLLYIIAVAEYIPFYGPAMSAVVITEAQKSAEGRAEMLLAEYVQKCRNAGIKHFKTLLGRGGHIGEVICRAAEDKNIHMLILGRRGMGKIKRLFIGSTSRYCVEHAPCSVACIKLPLAHTDSPVEVPHPLHEMHVHKDEVREEHTHGVATEIFTLQE